MTDPKEVEPMKEIEEKVDDEKKSEAEERGKAEDKEKTEDKVEAEDKEEKMEADADKMETDDKEKGDDDDKKEEEEPKEEDVAAAKAKTTKKRKEPVKAAEDEGDDKEDGEKDASDGRPKREKRVRKSADVFEPDNFLGKDKSLQVVPGRGTKLSEIAAIKATIDKLSMNSADLMLAHRLLYTRQGKPAKKEIKKNLHEFCGFLPLAAEGQDKKELELLEEEAEAKMSTKAYKLTIPLIKKLCDLFHVDRFKLETKDTLIDALLDFLGAPSEDRIKGGKKSKKAAAASAASAKSSGGKKKKKAAAVEEDDDEEDEDDDDDDDVPLKKGELPSDAALRKWVRAYVQCFNLKKATVKHAIATASDKFGVDVSKKKALLKELLTSEM